MKIRSLIIMSLLLLSSFAVFSTLHANSSGTNLVITEVLYDTPSCDTTCEWFELFNPTDTAISIAGWTISDNSATNTLPTAIIPAGGYYSVARDSVGFSSLYGFAPNTDILSLALGNTGDQLTLKDSTGAVIDFVAWENYVANWNIAAVDKSIYRLSDAAALPVDTDTVADWGVSQGLGDPNAGYGVGDITAPLVSILSPADLSVVSGTVSISCSASDDSGTISSYNLQIDGASVGATSSYDWDTTTVINGVHSIICEATDPSGNIGSQQISVTVDNTDPSLLFKVYYTDPLAGVPAMTNFAAQEGNISSGITTLLNAANISIHAALYHLSWQPVIDALVAAQNRGVTVQLAVHHDNYDEFSALVAAGITVHMVNTSYIMHNKFFIVDGLFVWTGSYNPTETGTLFNANDGIQVRSASLSQVYDAEFNQLFSNISGKSKVDNNEEIVSVGATTVEAYFAPKDSGLNRMITLIDGATSSIYISIFYLTENSIYDAIVRARDRGVVIKGVFDYRGWRNSYAEADDIIAWGGGVVDTNPGVYHHKFMVIDATIVWTGSTNFSAAGFGDNDENSIVIHDPSVAAHYIARTESFLQDAATYNSDSAAAPRIVTHHYSGYPGSNFITWTPHMSGNLPTNLVKEYLVWKWNESVSEFQLMQEVNWAVSYATDANVVVGQTYYYCVSALAWDGTVFGCSAEFAEVQNADGSYYQPTLYPATGHLTSYGIDLVAPIVHITNPVATSTVSGYIDITATATDSNYIQSWEILIDNTVVSHSNLFNWDTTDYSTGTHTIVIHATDSSGNVGTTSISVTVDNTAFIPPTAPNYSAVKFMTYNIAASGEFPEYKDVLKEENPDIVVLVEAGDFDDNSNSSLNALTVELNSYFSNELPYSPTLLYGQGSMYTGIALLSRFPILASELIPLVTLDDGTVFDVSHDFLSVILQVGTAELTVIGAHLKASSGTTNEYKRETAQEGILNYMDALGGSANIIYAGDLNSFSPDDIGALAPNGDLGYGPMNMTINPLHPHAPLVQSYTDVFRTLNPTDPGYSYYTSPYESRIDFILVNQNLAASLVSSTVGDTPSATLGSDHYAVDAILNLGMWQPADTIPPSQVTGLTAVNIAATSIDLNWDTNTESDFAYYTIYRDAILIGTAASASYTDSGLLAGVQYTYEVTAVDTAGNEGVSSTPLAVTTATVGLDHVIISEVYYDTVGTDSIEEWIELYNPMNVAVDLSGWTISDNYGTYLLPTGTVLNSHSYLVVARSATGFSALYGFSPDISGLTLSLGNSGDQLTLKDSMGSVVDFVAWENYAVGWSIVASTGKTIARVDVTTDTDSVADWTILPNNGTPAIA